MASRRGMRRFQASYPTVEQINAEGITKLALDNWAADDNVQNAKRPFSLDIVRNIYADIVAGRFSNRRLILLDYSQYLEQYLWPNFKVETSQFTEVVMSIVALVNVKKRERVPVWDAFKEKPEFFPLFFKCVMDLCLSPTEPSAAENERRKTLSLVEHCQLLLFLSHFVNSLEEDLIREQAQRIFGLPIWLSLSTKRLEVEIKKVPNLKKLWDKLLKKEQQKDEAAKNAENFYRFFMRNLMEKFQSVMHAVPKDGPLIPGPQSYCEHFLTLMIDCQSALNTRRFFHAVLDDAHVLVRCRLSTLFSRPEGRVFSQLVEALEFYSSYEITLTGNDMTEQERSTDHYNRMTTLQRIIYSSFPDQEWSKKFATSAVFKLDSREALQTFFNGLNMDQLRQIADRIGVLGRANLVGSGDGTDEISKAILCEVLIEYHEKRISMLERVNDMPIYPTEDMIWDEALVPEDVGNTSETMPLPKLHLQFLSLHDYLLRNFQLFRLESAYEIRTDIEDVVARMKPWKNEQGGVVFGGWARMALPINQFEIWDVGKPHVGCKQPSRVRAKVTMTLNVRDNIKNEWEKLRKHDVCFLITVKPSGTYGTPLNHEDHFINQTGLTYVRGCEIEGMLDDRGNLIDELTDQRPQLRGETRTFRVWMDPNQYYLDAGNHPNAPKENIYQSFNIIMRRRPEENNFKAVLETIRNLINSEWMVPDWLHDVLLGYGDPESAHWTRMPNKQSSLDFNDTFLSAEHVKACFLDQTLEFQSSKNLPMEPPFRLTFPVGDKTDGGVKRTADGEAVGVPKTLVVEPYEPRMTSPYVASTAKKNAVPFTPTQLEAIISGMQPGLTLVVGPPGTGKTDVAVQIISNIYHNFPEQRTLIVTHSNQALNQLFEKIMHLDVDERHLLRLGHGEEALETKKDFSRYGRVNYVLSKRLELLSEVSRLQTCLKVPGDVGYTCETAGHFYLYQVLKRWQEYKAATKRLSSNSTSSVEDRQRDSQLIREYHANMAGFFPEAPQPMFTEDQDSVEKNLNTAEVCFRYIDNIFTQLEEFRPFELLRSGLDRTRYLLTKEAKIIAMTCTHAGMKRQELVELGFKYDNVLMEEAAQILEVETFIPLLLQKPERGVNRLKRWIMIGDHNQLPPIVQNKVFEKYCNMEQSLFTRFVRLGMPTVDLDAQGRMRPSLCQLFSWRYKRLGNLPHTYRMPAFLTANAGFAYDYQLINVDDFNGVGESEPSAHFVQNLAEAEYITATFMYMRLMGYPAESITILSTYNGQKHLIRDVLEKRCGGNPLIGMPHKVATVDKYQGQQNDYVLLSLVRTKTIGYLRDVRRMVVALSRARLGLYIFGRVPLFKNSLELSPAFSVLMQRPTKLHLVPNESFPTHRTLEATQSESLVVMNDMPEMMNFVYRFYEQKVQLLKPLLQRKAKEDESSEDEDDEEEEPTVTETAQTGEAPVDGAVEGAVEGVVEGAVEGVVENLETRTSSHTPVTGPQQFIPRSELPFFPIRGDRGMVMVQDDAEMDEEEGIEAGKEAKVGEKKIELAKQ